MSVTVDMLDSDEPYAFADVRLAVGERLLVRVAELPGSGYRWDVEALPDGLATDADADEPVAVTEDAGRLVGGSRSRTLTFVARGPVQGTLRMRCHRCWEHGAPPSRRAYIRLRAT